MLLLGTDPSVGIRVIYYLLLIEWIYCESHKFTSDPSCTHTRALTSLAHSLSL